MGKAKISNKRKKFLENTQTLKLKADDEMITYRPKEDSLDEIFIALAVWECLKNNDPDGIFEILQKNFSVVNK